MAALRGERFQVDLDSDEEDDGGTSKTQKPTAPVFPSGLVKDIQEQHSSGFSRPPLAPSSRATATGFPIHRKRTAAPSRFKQARHEETTPSIASTFQDKERHDIDRENRERLVHMSPNTIVQEQQDLLQGLPPSLIQRLLRRATVDDPPKEYAEPTPDDTSVEIPSTTPPADARATDDRGHKGVTPDVPDGPLLRTEGDTNPNIKENMAPSQPLHFPRPKQPPSLDPSSSTFLSDLHEKYFPDLTADPSKLAWMMEPSTTERDSYSTNLDSLPVSALRFSFSGALLPPSLSESIPTTAGLHHHGSSPAAAGYTVAELAHLARSSFPSQRCIAFQTLGRVLYRLGKGEFGLGEEGHDLDRGLWGCMREGRVLETLQEEAGRTSGHVSARAYAVDALWLWQRGGGKEPIEFNAG